MRNKAIAIESISVLIVLILFALTVFISIDAGATAFDTVVNKKKSMEIARVAYSYICTKIRQNDEAFLIDVTETEYGSALCIDLKDFNTYIFFSDGKLYECITAKDRLPKVEAANSITALDGFEIKRDGNYICVTFVIDSGDKTQTVKGMVGLRT